MLSARAWHCAFAVGVLALAAPGTAVRRPVPPHGPSHLADTLVVHSAAATPSQQRHLVLDWRTGTRGVKDSSTFGRIETIAISRADAIYVWDAQVSELRLFDADGSFVKQIGRKGGGPGEYDRVNGLDVLPDGRVVMWDGGNARLNVYSASGEALATWRPPITGFFTSAAVSSDTLGRVWLRGWITRKAADGSGSASDAWFVLDGSGVVRDTVIGPEFAGGDGSFVVRTPSGGMVGRPRPYARAAVHAVSAFGRLVSGPSDPYVLHSWFNGRPLRITHDWTPVLITRDERAQRRAFTEWSIRQSAPGWIWEGSDVPSTKPAYVSLLPGKDGRVWVQVSVESERFTPAALPGAAVVARPAVTFRARERAWDVYGPDGVFLWQVHASTRITPLVTRGNLVWGVVLDDDDVPSLARWHVEPDR
jgi:hypothetical protein